MFSALQYCTLNLNKKGKRLNETEIFPFLSEQMNDLFE